MHRSAPGRRRRRGSHSGLLHLVVIAALVAPLVSPTLGADLWGWLPDHGHVGAASVGAHQHPWDAAGEAGRADAASAPRVVFTAGDLLGAPAVPVALAVLVAVPLLVGTLVPAPFVTPMRPSGAVPEPPPPR